MCPAASLRAVPQPTERAAASRDANTDPGFFCRTSGLSNSMTWQETEDRVTGERGQEGPGCPPLPPPRPRCDPHLPAAQDQDAVAAEDGGDAVGDGQPRAAPEGLTERALDQGVGLHVQGGRGFVDDDDLWDTKRGEGGRLGPRDAAWTWLCLRIRVPEPGIRTAVGARFQF